MQKKIFYAVFLTTFFIQFFGILLIVHTLYQLSIQNSFGGLRKTSTLFTQETILQLLSGKVYDINSDSLVLMGLEGNVFYKDSNTTLTQQEIQNLSIKKEITLIKPFSYEYHSLYFAKIIPFYGERIILLLSTNAPTFYTFIVPLIPYFLFILVATFLFSLLSARIVTQSFVDKINRIDTAYPLNTNPYREFDYLMQKIDFQNKKNKKHNKITKWQQKEFKLTLQNMRDGFLLFDSKGSILAFNPSAIEYLGQLQLGDNVLQSSIPAELSELVNSLLINGGQQNDTVSITINGRYIEIICLPLLGKNKPKGLMVLLFDKSSHIEAQKLRREFSANVTHELKTPLTVILASSEMLQNQLIQVEDIPKFVNKIHDEAKRLLVMIDEIIKLSFFDENTLGLQKVRINLLAVASKVVQNLQVLAKEKDVRLEVEGQTSMILGVYSLVEDIIYNLCENAIKYNCKNGLVKVSVTESHNKVILCVKDSGIGIPKEYQTRVFERFFCVDKSRSKRLGGTGLGLSIVKQLADYHNAEIELTSLVDEGTEIRLIFPSAPTT